MPPEPEDLHTDAQLAALAEVMPSVPETLETGAAPSSWPLEQLVPSAGAAPSSLKSASTIRSGGVVIRPSTGRSVRWTPIEPVADEYDAAEALPGFSCLGVIGNASHLRGSGGHTPWCTEGYGGKSCIFGKVYAIDLEVPNMSGFERWFAAKMRANVYKWIYYFNINGHQYTRVDSFRGRYTSADYHVHLSGLAGHENDNSTILRDWQAYRTNGGDDMASVPQAQWDRARKQLDAISDSVVGGAGEAYQSSVMRKDHGYQISELKAYVDERLTTIESKLDALLAAQPAQKAQPSSTTTSS